MSLGAGTAAVARPGVGRVQLVAVLYALWLVGLTIAAHLMQSRVLLEVILLSGAVPTLAQSMFLPADTRGTGPGLWFLWAFLSVFLASYLVNEATWEDIVNVLNVSFVFLIGFVIVSCTDLSLVPRIVGTYAVLMCPYLLYINLFGSYTWGRLDAGAQPNLWGLIAINVAAGAFCLRNRLLAGPCWAIALLTVYNAQARGSMVAMVPIFIAAAYYFLAYERRIDVSWKVVGIVTVLIAGLLFIAVEPDFFIDKVMRLNDPYRGVNSGATGRDEAWGAALRLWYEQPLLGVGYRKHEQFMVITQASSSHNAYIAMLADTGFIGFLLYLGFVVGAFLCALQGIADHRLRLIILAVIASYGLAGLFERRAINVGNAYSITFILFCLLSLRLARFPYVAGPAHSPLLFHVPHVVREAAADIAPAAAAGGDTGDAEARAGFARDVVETYLDVDAIARTGLGRHRRAITTAQWREFRGLLRDLIVHGYALHFATLSPETLEVDSVVVTGSRRAVVRSRVQRPSDGQSIAVDWRIRTSAAHDGTFRVTDVVIEGTSAARTLYADVSALMESSGIERVCTVLRHQVGEMRAQLG